MKITVDDVELTVVQDGASVHIKRVVGRDRKRCVDLERGLTFNITYTDPPSAIALVDRLKRVAKYQTARCTCDYRYGYSDHAKHCLSIQVAQEFRGDPDD